MLYLSSLTETVGFVGRVEGFTFCVELCYVGKFAATLLKQFQFRGESRSAEVGHIIGYLTDESCPKTQDDISSTSVFLLVLV